jgi:hypothetical protein
MQYPMQYRDSTPCSTRTVLHAVPRRPPRAPRGIFRRMRCRVARDCCTLRLDWLRVAFVRCNVRLRMRMHQECDRSLHRMA